MGNRQRRNQVINRFAIYFDLLDSGLATFDPDDPFSDSYFSPDDDVSAAKIELCWRSVTAAAPATARELVNSGRSIAIPECTEDGVARFDFEELCDRALGPKDYLAIAREYHTIFLHGIPMMNMQRRDQASEATRT